MYYGDLGNVSGARAPFQPVQTTIKSNGGEIKETTGETQAKPSTNELWNECDVTFDNSREIVNIKAQDSDGKNLTNQEIKASVDNLKPGEQFTYYNNSNISGKNSSLAVVWTRNEDNTLTRTEQLFTEVPENYDGKTTLTTNYASDGKTKLSEERTNVIGNTRYISTENYEKGKRSSIVTNFADAVENVENASATSSSQCIKYLKDNAGQFKSNVFNDSNGNVLLTFKDGKFYNAKGAEIDENNASAILENARNKNMLGNLVQTYPKQNLFEGLW